LDRPVDFVSENVERLLGYPAAAFEGGLKYTSLIHEDDLERVEAEVSQASQDQKIERFSHQPYRIVKADGEVRWVDDHTLLRKNGDGVITHFEGIVTDVTQREEQLRISHFQADRTQLLLGIPGFMKGRGEQAFIQACLAEAERITANDSSFIYLLASDQEELVLITGQAELAERLPPKVTLDSIPAQSLGSWPQAYREQEPVVVDHGLDSADDEPCAAWSNTLNRSICVPVIENGECVMVACASSEATWHAELEVETWSLIAKEIWQAIQKSRSESEREALVVELGERIKELRTMYRLSRAINLSQDEDELMHNAVNLIPAGWQYPDKTCARITMGGKAYTSSEFQETEWCQRGKITVTGKDPGLLEVFYLGEEPVPEGSPFLPDEQILIKGLVLALSSAADHFHSQRERRKAEQQLRHSQKMEAVGQLTGGIAHDFNNLLGVILGNVDLLYLESSIDDKLMKRLDSISKSAQRAADLTKQLLGFSHNHPTSTSVENLNSIIQRNHHLLERSLTPAIKVTHSLEEDLWPTEIDTGGFENALLNLVINANDAMPEGGDLLIETRNVCLSRRDCRDYLGVQPGDSCDSRSRILGSASPVKTLVGFSSHSSPPRSLGMGQVSALPWSTALPNALAGLSAAIQCLERAPSSCCSCHAQNVNLPLLNKAESVLAPQPVARKQSLS